MAGGGFGVGNSGRHSGVMRYDPGDQNSDQNIRDQNILTRTFGQESSERV
jgi:hypothetical protein